MSKKKIDLPLDESYFDRCKLTPMERHVIRLRRGIPVYPMTLDEIGKIFKITRERVRQLEHETLRQLSNSKKYKKQRKRLAEFLYDDHDVSLVNRKY